RAEDMIRAKEKYIADFYYKTEVYEAARWRYLHILDNFKEKDLIRHSMQRVILSSFHLKDYEKCASFARKYSSILHEDSKGKDSKNLEEAITACDKKLKQ
ncbi:MAG: hypothetical protein WEB87_04130, partial [Bacteriovoracaceae bacterium]